MTKSPLIVAKKFILSLFQISAVLKNLKVISFDLIINADTEKFPEFPDLISKW
jgi:hypothetical protein